jgi:hypothetical protein
MRKIKPEDVRTDFASGMADIRGFYEAARAAIAGDRDRTFLVESTLLSAAVLWEGFVSDLFLAYINRDSSQFAVHLRLALTQALDGKAKAQRVIDSFAAIQIPEHLSRSQISDLIDPRGGNITFRNYADLRAGAERFLTAANRQGIDGRPAPEQRTIDALIAVRNHLAHRSQQSYDTMNEVLHDGALHTTGLRRGPNKVTKVGPWLKAQPTQQQPPRIEIFLARLDAIAAAI